MNKAAAPIGSAYMTTTTATKSVRLTDLLIHFNIGGVQFKNVATSGQARKLSAKVQVVCRTKSMWVIDPLLIFITIAHNILLT